MSKKNSLSVVISVFNGENELNNCLKSVSFADEIIVVNNSSTDKTLEIARQYADKIFTRPNYPMLNINKNFGFSKVSCDWILSLDADESVSIELKEEIMNVLEVLKNGKWKMENGKSDISGYWIPRKNIIFGKWIEHTGWYPDHQLRLFRSGKGKFEEKHVHELVKVAGKVEYLKNNLIHFNYTSISQFLQKLQLYALNETQNLIEGGYQFAWQDAIRFPLKEFLSRFFTREGYKDGFHGLMLSLLMAFYHLIVFANIWEKREFEKIEEKDFLKKVDIEINKSYEQLRFWVNNEKLKSIEHPLRKIIHKISGKIQGL